MQLALLSSAALYILATTSSCRLSKREKKRREARVEESEQREREDDLNSPKRADETTPLVPRRVAASRRPLTFPILSPTGPARNSSARFPSPAFLPLSFATFRSILPVLEPRAGNSCSNGFVAAIPTVLSRCSSCAFDDDSTFSGFSRLFACLSRYGRLESSFISIASPNDPPISTIVMTLLEKRLNGLWV